MSTAGIPEKNRIAWTNRANGALESYADILYKGASWRQDSFASDIPQRYAYYMLQDGVSLLVTGHENEADKIFILTEEIANEAFLTENQRGGFAPHNPILRMTTAPPISSDVSANPTHQRKATRGYIIA